MPLRPSRRFGVASVGTGRVATYAEVLLAYGSISVRANASRGRLNLLVAVALPRGLLSLLLGHCVYCL